MKIRAHEERSKRGAREGERTDDETQAATLRLFVMVNFASQTTRWRVDNQLLPCRDALRMVAI
jgi:hypothetical protein